MVDTIAALRGVPVFAGLSDDELAAIVPLVEDAEFPEAYPLMVQGLPATEMAIIVEGAAAVRRDDETVARLGPGDVVGEIALLARRRRTASVVTTAPSRLLILDADGFDRLLADHPSIAPKVLRIVADRLAELEASGP